MEEHKNTDDARQAQLDSAQQETTWIARAAEIFDHYKGRLGTIDAPNQEGLLVLAREGKDIWNSWRKAYPETSPDFSNSHFFSIDFSGFLFPAVEGAPCAKFANCVFRENINFTGAIFGDHAIFENVKFWNKAEFRDAIFGKEAKFSDTRFNIEAQFNNSEFGSHANFEKTSFGGIAEFSHATFGDEAKFDQSNFHDDAYFIDSTFGEKTTFKEANFAKNSLFSSAHFDDITIFHGSNFFGIADFRSCKFGKNADFEMAEFHEMSFFEGTSFDDDASFTEASFKSLASFDNTKFKGSARFSATDEKGGISKKIASHRLSFEGAFFSGNVTFNNRNFLSTTNFGPSKDQNSDLNPTRFHGIPYFHGCKFHQDTSFDGAEFHAPPSPEAARAYRTLKLAMEQLKATREEQKFFRLEMKAEHPSLPRGKRWISTLYSVFSDYGFSLWRPVIALLVFSLFFGAGYGVLADACASNQECIQAAITAKVTSSADRTSDLLKYTLASVAPVPGLDKMQTELRAPLFGQHGWIAVTAVVLEIFHKIVALVMTFLFALALRNLFKMKS